ncbi:MAG: hypothetical protein JSS27_16525 [Planctomycetes bacterium]|nr:hypothetical protein [Planctomycetota bacterium]
MAKDLIDCMAAGVFVEFQDADGHVLAQSVFTDWHSRNVPDLGDGVRCRARGVTSGLEQQFAGRVVDRHFEVQREDDRACVWVRLIVSVTRTPPVRRRTLTFSAN